MRTPKPPMTSLIGCASKGARRPKRQAHRSTTPVGSGWYVVCRGHGPKPRRQSPTDRPFPECTAAGGHRSVSCSGTTMYGANVNRVQRVHPLFRVAEYTKRLCCTQSTAHKGNQWLKAEKTIDSRDNWGVSIFHSLILYFK